MEEKSPPIKAYLYSIKTGKLVVYEGFVTPTIWDLRLRFLGKKKRLLVPLEPGEVCDSSLWLSERDDAKARKLLIRNEERHLLELYKQVANHQDKIKTLEGVEIHEGQATSRKTRTSLR